MISTTTPNDDDDDGDEHHQLLSPSLNINFLPIVSTTITTNGVVSSHTAIDMMENINELIATGYLSCANQPLLHSLSTNIQDLPSNMPEHLSTSNSDHGIVQPLLDNDLQKVPNAFPTDGYQEEERISSSASTASSTSSENSTVPNDRSCMKFYFTDMLVSAFIITPLLNIHWRGAWDLLDIHLLPDYPIMSALISLGIGLIMLYTMYLSQGYLQVFYEKYRRNLVGQIMTRLYTLVLAFAYIHQWRGLWNLLDLTSNTWYHLTGETVISVTFLLLMGSAYNLNSAPFLLGVDTEYYFLIDSKHTVSTKHFLQYTFDFFYYEIVEAPLLIIAWHGLYSLSDSYIFPDDKFMSMTVSFASGYLLYFLLALIQLPVLRCLIKLRRPKVYTSICNIFHLTAFVSGVQIWRSLWLVCEQYLNIPDHHDLTLWLCYGVPFIVLTCGLAACSLNGPVSSKDSYIDEGPVLPFNFDYFSILLKVSLKNQSISQRISNLSLMMITNMRFFTMK